MALLGVPKFMQDFNYVHLCIICKIWMSKTECVISRLGKRNFQNWVKNTETSRSKNGSEFKINQVWNTYILRSENMGEPKYEHVKFYSRCLFTIIHDACIYALLKPQIAYSTPRGETLVWWGTLLSGAELHP